MRHCAEVRNDAGEVGTLSYSVSLAGGRSDESSWWRRRFGGAGREQRHVPTILFIWDRFGPYHVDRCEACARHFGDRCRIYGIEIASYDDIYEWKKSRGGQGFQKLTLFPDMRRTTVSQIACFVKLLRTILRLRADYVFTCNYEDPVIFLASSVLRILRRPVFIMQDSKFDDKQRRLFFELLKWVLYLPYNGALAGSQRTASYLEFLGVPKDRIFIGYDTVSVGRIRALAKSPPAPDGMPHALRHFSIIARFVPKKNLALALDAYAMYAGSHAGHPRELHLCGSGELEPELRQHCERLNLTGVKFCGFVQEEEVARKLASSLALILPSTEEQYGLVVNEAIAMGVPVLLSENCGARDVLVRSGVNGFLFEPDNANGLAHYMRLLDQDEDEWRRMAKNCENFVPMADTMLFAHTVERALHGMGKWGLSREQAG